MKKNQLLIIQSQTFGYLTDSLKWCEYIKDKYEVTVICQNTKKKKLITDGIKVKYLKSFGNRQMRGLLFVTQCIFKIALFSGKIMVIYFEHCEIFKSIFPWKKMLLDIRTMSVSQNEQRRRIYNKGIINACKKFDIITAISQGVKKQINLPDKPIYILPLGADHISVRKKDYDQLHLLYVGTFAGRDIDKTIDAISIFKKTHPEIPITYDIIGSGFNNEIEQFNQKIKALNLGEIITLHGRIPSNRLKPYFDKSVLQMGF